MRPRPHLLEVPHHQRLRAQTSTLAEIARTHTELAAIGLTRQHVVINGVLPAPADDTDALATAIYRREQAAMTALPAVLRGLPVDQVGLKAADMVGVDALQALFGPSLIREDAVTAGERDFTDAPLADLIDSLATDDHGLILCMTSTHGRG